jgi:hypothetical protein
MREAVPARTVSCLTPSKVGASEGSIELDDAIRNWDDETFN